MQKEVKRFPLWGWEVIVLAVVTPAIFLYCYVKLYGSEFTGIDMMPLFMWFLVVGLLDAGTIWAAVKLRPIAVELRILACWLVLVISAALLTYLFLMWALKGAFA
jgi:hypothetical protein